MSDGTYIIEWPCTVHWWPGGTLTTLNSTLIQSSEEPLTLVLPNEGSPTSGSAISINVDIDEDEIMTVISGVLQIVNGKPTVTQTVISGDPMPVVPPGGQPL
jgi:hypothetical protein